MSKLLNNRWVVATLGVLALATLYNRVVQPVLKYSQVPSQEVAAIGDGLTPVERSDAPQNGIDQEFQLVSAQYDLKRIDTANIRWNTSPSRDPFTPQSRLEREDITAIKIKADKIPVPKVIRSVKRTKHSLSAIVNSSSKSFAVIDGEIVQSGDRVGRYLVGEIHDADVGLTHLDTGRTMQLEVNN